MSILLSVNSLSVILVVVVVVVVVSSSSSSSYYYYYFLNALGSKGSRGLKIKFKNTYKSWKS